MRIASNCSLLSSIHCLRSRESIAVLSWLPALAQNGLAWVCAEPRLSRLHLHFRELAHVVHALKAAPLLVRCGALPNRWSDAPCGVARHEHPEALVLSCVPTEQLPNAPGACDAAVKTLLTSMGIGWQSFWQSHKTTEGCGDWAWWSAFSRLLLRAHPRGGSSSAGPSRRTRSSSAQTLWRARLCAGTQYAAASALQRLSRTRSRTGEMSDLRWHRCAPAVQESAVACTHAAAEAARQCTLSHARQLTC